MMKTKEVIKELGKMNLRTQVCDDFLVVINCCGEIVAKVSLKRKFEVDTNFWTFSDNLIECEKEKVFVLLTKLAETDPQDREEEKKYYLKHRWISCNCFCHLNLYTNENKYIIESDSDIDGFKTQFTQAEIDKIKEKFNTTLEDFELIEVEE